MVGCLDSPHGARNKNIPVGVVTLYWRPYCSLDCDVYNYVTYVYMRTSLCYRRPHAMRSVSPIAMYTKVDAQCDKLATVVGRLLTAVTSVDVPWRDSCRLSPEFGML